LSGRIAATGRHPPWDPTLIIFGIRALIRLAREGISAFNQFERDRPALFPDGVSPDFRPIDFIRNTFFPDHAGSPCPLAVEDAR
jgi:hypothetical protein